MNKVILIGRLGKDPEVRYTDNGKAVCNFSIATNEGKDKEATWHDIVAWEKTAELCGEYLTKGKQVAIEGRIQKRKWQDRDGKDRIQTEVVAHRVEFLGSRDDGDSNQGNRNQGGGNRNQGNGNNQGGGRGQGGFDYGPPPDVDDPPF